MAFVYDPAEKRTHDPHRNWTLRVVHQFTDGDCDFGIESPNRHIYFTARSNWTFPGPLIHWAVWNLRATGDAGEGEALQQIVTDALAAFKQLNGLPEQASVAVTFADHESPVQT